MIIIEFFYNSFKQQLSYGNEIGQLFLCSTIIRITKLAV